MMIFRKLQDIVHYDFIRSLSIEFYAEFAAMYSHTGRPSVPQEKLLKALLPVRNLTDLGKVDIMVPKWFHIGTMEVSPYQA